MPQKKALVVDNEKVMVEIVSGILEKEGFQVEKAYGGLEALVKLKQEKFEIVFLDLIMPSVGGGRICQFIKQSPEHRDTKVVIISACAIEAEQQMNEYNADLCIAKSSFPKMKDNIIKALTLTEESEREPDGMILGREGIEGRTVVMELLFSQKYFEAILNSMTEGVIELDTENVITYVNIAAQNMMGKKEWELIGLNFTAGFGDEKAKEINLLLSELSKSSGIETKDIIIESPGGKDLSFSFKNVIRDSETIGSTIVINDITEKKLLEQERFLRERLTGVMEMAITAAHELNQPLSVISGNSQLLLNDAKNCNDKVIKRITSILDQVERLAELTKKFSNIVAYKTKNYGENIKIVDIEKASLYDDKTELKGLWE
jgi:PAS domain S-box-containing protein